MKIRGVSFSILVSLVLVPCLATAHPAWENAATASHGVSHAFSGIDHWMLSLGLGFWLTYRPRTRRAWISMLVVAGIGAACVAVHRATLSGGDAVVSLAISMALQILMGSLVGRAFHQWRPSDWLMGGRSALKFLRAPGSGSRI